MIRMLRSFFLVSVAVSALVLEVSCGDSGVKSESQRIEGVDWQVDNILGVDPMMLMTLTNRVTMIMLPDSTFSGATGCNSFVGRYVIGGEYVGVGGDAQGTSVQFTIEEMGNNFCLQGVVEQGFVEQLGIATHYRVESDTLKLFNGENECTMKLVKGKF